MPKVLLVEDDNNLREIFQMRLQAEGYAAVTAADGEEGLATAIKEKPDLIIADVMMPKLSGFEMIENLRSAPEMKNTKVIMMTALGQAEDQARGEKLGVVKYLVKSQVTLEDFARVVKEILGPGSDQPIPAAPQSDNTTTNTQESEGSMQEDASQNNQVPASDPAAAPAADASMPAPAADMSAPAPNVATGEGQQSSAEEQSVVENQINNFTGSTPDAAAAPAADMPASDPAAAPAADASMPAPAADMSAPAMPPASDPAAPVEPPASTDQPATPPADPTSNAL